MELSNQKCQEDQKEKGSQGVDIRLWNPRHRFSSKNPFVSVGPDVNIPDNSLHLLVDIPD